MKKFEFGCGVWGRGLKESWKMKQGDKKFLGYMEEDQLKVASNQSHLADHLGIL